MSCWSRITELHILYSSYPGIIKSVFFCDGHPHRTIFIRYLLCYTASDGQVANEWKEVAPLAITVMITRQSGAACGIHQYLSHWFQEL